ncbi:MAG: FecR domain-containing protein [Chitinophagaceae bacterium]|nr:FecR domain-containing protein [Chitinophagaceae bacterium]
MNDDHVNLLIQKYADGTITPGERRLLMEWFRSVDNAEVVWEGEGGERERVRNRMLAKLNKSIDAKPSRVVQIPFARVAAVLLVAVGIAVFGYFIVDKDSSEFNTVTNSYGKVHLVQLPDSSKVWLNASTTLRYNKSFTKHRELQLDGEAFFEVTKDPEHEFVIKTGEVTTTVVGTSFNVTAYKDDEWKTVAVVTGKVKVEDGYKQLALLTPARKLRYDGRTKKSEVLDADTSNVLSWTRGKLRFDGEPLSGITRLLSRWYGYSFTFTNTELKNCRYYLNLDNTLDIDEVMNVLREVTGVQIAIDHTSKSISINGTSCQ